MDWRSRDARRGGDEACGGARARCPGRLRGSRRTASRPGCRGSGAWLSSSPAPWALGLRPGPRSEYVDMRLCCAVCLPRAVCDGEAGRASSRARAAAGGRQPGTHRQAADGCRHTQTRARSCYSPIPRARRSGRRRTQVDLGSTGGRQLWAAPPAAGRRPPSLQALGPCPRRAP